GSAGLARGCRGQALSRLPARSIRQQDLRAAPRQLTPLRPGRAATPTLGARACPRADSLVAEETTRCRGVRPPVTPKTVPDLGQGHCLQVDTAKIATHGR